MERPQSLPKAVIAVPDASGGTGQEQRQHHNPCDNRKLGGLKIDWSQMQPAARSINFGPDELGQDQKHNAGQVHRQGAPANPPVVDQTGQHEREDTYAHPVCLLPPEVGGIRVAARGRRAVDCHDAKNGEG